MTDSLLAKDLSPELWNDFVAYFEYNGTCSGCWCMNHRLPCGLDVEGEAAKLAMKQLVLSGRVFGVLAYVDGDPVPVGWCAVDKRKTLPGHDCILEKIDCKDEHWSIHCVTSRRDFKMRGVEEFLSAEALLLAKRHQATLVEAYPEPGSQSGQEFRSWNSFSGHQSSYELLGFTAIEKDCQPDNEFYRAMNWRL